MKNLLIIGTVALSGVAFGQSLSLESSVSTAFANRPSLIAAQLKVESSKSAAQALGAFPPTELGIGQSTRADLGATDMDLFISQSLDIFGRSRTNRRIGEAEVRKAEAHVRLTKLDIQTEVVTQYFETVASIKLKSSADSLLVLSESLLKATTRRFEEGKIPEVQVTRAQLEFERSKQTALLRDSQARAALSRLSGITGTDIGFDDVDTRVSLAVDYTKNFDQIPAIQIAQADLETSMAKVQATRKSNLPELEVIGLRSPWRNSSTNFGARLQLTWSFNDFGKQNNNVKSLQQEIKSIKESIEDLKLSVATEINASMIEIDTSRNRVESYQKLLEINRTLVAKSQLGFEQGVGTLIDVLEASRSLRELEQEISEAELDLNLSIAALYSITGTLLEEVK